MSKARITDRALASLRPGGTVWDTDVAGLGARLQAAGGRVVFILKYRSPVERDATGRGRQRVVTIGRRGRGDLGIDDARREATALRLELRAGRDPALARDEARAALTVADLCDLYVGALPTILVRGRPKKASTIASDRSNIERHIKPLVGGYAVAAVTPAHVRDFLAKVAVGRTALPRAPGAAGSPVTGGKGAATRATGLLSGIMAFAVREGLRADNPVHGVARYADGRRDRRLADAEYASLARGLREAEGQVWRAALSMTRFLLLTGWRSGEARALRWGDVDLARRMVVLADSKTGRSVRPLATAACDVLRALPGAGGPSDALVFRGANGGAVTAYGRLFARAAKLAGLAADVTPHVLRHSFASLAADLEYSEATIGALIGHRTGSITGRYIHRADLPLLAAADRVAGETLARMGEGSALGQVVPLRTATA